MPVTPRPDASVRRHRRPGLPAALLGALALTAGPMLASASASVSAAAVGHGAQVNNARLTDVVPRLDRQDFSAALTAADIDRGGRDLLMMVFDNYQGALLEVAGELEARRVAAGRDRFDDAIAGRIRLDPDQLAALRRDIALADLSTWGPASQALEELLELSRLSLDPDVCARFEASLPGLRRSAFLGSLADGESNRLEAGESVDLEDLVVAAEQEELRGAPGAPLDAALTAWAATIDPIVGAAAGEIRAARIERRVARSARDARAVAEADERLIAAWRQLHEPLMTASRRIEAIARDVGGESAAATWRNRVRLARFPWLFESARRPELAAAWVGRNADAERAAEARTIAAQWSRDRGGCDAETIDLLLEARLELGRIVHPRSNLSLLGGGRSAEIFRELLRISGRAEQLDREAEEAIAALLEPGDRGRMRADLRAMSLRRGR